MTKKVLIDLSVRKDALTHRTVPAKKMIAWGGIPREVEVVVRKPFPPRPDENFRMEQIPYVAALPELVSAGHIQLFRSMELVMEDVRNIRRDRGYLGLDVLEGIPIGSVEPPVSRTVVFGGRQRSLGITKEEQIAFFKSITDERFREIRRATNKAVKPNPLKPEPPGKKHQSTHKSVTCKSATSTQRIRDVTELLTRILPAL